MKNRLRLTLIAIGLMGTLSTNVLAAPAKNPHVRIDTNMGSFVVELNAKAAPKTVKNFLAYAKSGHYKNTIFHRVIPGFMVQGGGMDESLNEKETRAPIPLEARNGLTNKRGTIAMARTSDPNSATSQFFINVANNHFLDAGRAADGHGYAVFGQVVSGMQTIDAIASVRTHSVSYHDDVPLRPIVIKNVSVLKGK